jgi:hypothetical protein
MARIDVVAGAGDAVPPYPPQGVAGVADGVRANATVRWVAVATKVKKRY